jgi:ABC-type glycerol-3-phosphate transport system substrate-binding protein
MWLPWPPDYDYVATMSHTSIKEYQSTTSNTMEMATIGNADMLTKFTVASKSGQTPDILFVPNNFGTFTFYGDLLPLDDIVYKDLAIPQDDFYPSVIKPYVINGKLYAFPGQAGIKCYLYRKDFFQDAGISKFPDTWEDFATVAAKLTKTDSSGAITQSGFEMGRTPESEQVITLAKQNGGDEFDEPLQGKSLVSAPEFVEALTWHLDLQRKQKVAPMSGTTTPPNTFSVFAGTAAITYIGPWWVPTVYVKAPADMSDKLGIGLPLNRKKRVGLMNANGSLSIYSKSKNKDAAVQFLKTWASPANYTAFHTPEVVGKWGTFSARKSIDANNKWLTGQPLLWTGAFHDAMTNNWGDDFGEAHIGYIEDRAKLYNPALQRALGGSGADTDKQAMTDLAAQIDAVTARYKAQSGL